MRKHEAHLEDLAFTDGVHLIIALYLKKKKKLCVLL